MYALFFTLLLFFLLLFVRSNNDKFREGVTNNASSGTTSSDKASYQSYSGTDPMILAQKNAANIQYMQEKLKDLQGLESNFNSLTSSVNTNTNNIKKMAQYAAKQITSQTGITPQGGVPPAVAGLSSITNNPSNNTSQPTTN